MQNTPVICVVGLGYVGLPLAAAFGKTSWKTIGYDVDGERIASLKRGEDRTNELSAEDLRATSVEYADDPAVIARANTIIVTVPTPVDSANNPDLTFVKNATETVGAHLQRDSVVIYESTVYPGVTEEICVPILEKASGLRCGTDFAVGYSPERINPGDKEHTIDKIVKVVAGQDTETTERIARIYEAIVPAGVFRAANIKAAELAKALENTQRDLNIALMNETARLCDRLGIRTKDVLDAAGTKWNFLPFTPGLVGGHCIGVDPYYLVHKAKDLGMHTEVISAGRKINDTQASFVEKQILRAMAKEKINPLEANVLVMGLTFKENVPDTRNAKIHDLIRKLRASGCTVHGHDPFLSEEAVRGIGILPAALSGDTYDAVIVGVLHDEYARMSAQELVALLKRPGIVYDVKSHWDPADFAREERTYLSL